MLTEPPPPPWHAFLLALDGLVKEEVQLHCLGGFAVTQGYGMGRTTADVDVLSAGIAESARQQLSAGTRFGVLHMEHGVYLDLVHLFAQPENHESRLREVFSGIYRSLRLFVLDPYDIALTKLERNIERDREDVLYLARTIPFDLDVLRKRYQEELRVYLGRPEREDLTLQLWVDAIQEDRKR